MNLNECGNAKAMTKQQSILENEIESLRSEIVRVNKLSDAVLDILRPSPPCTAGCDQNVPTTVADSMRGIRTIAEWSRENLESALRILEEQLGSLKLEY